MDKSNMAGGTAGIEPRSRSPDSQNTVELGILARGGDIPDYLKARIYERIRAPEGSHSGLRWI
jgi:hypothetical protein